MHREMAYGEVAREVHENALAHGWWDRERDIEEVFALIHSEWSEELEEDRAGRPDRWYLCESSHSPGVCVASARNDIECVYYGPESDEMAKMCVFRSRKPEGVCVELMDGVIRILDLIGHLAEKEQLDLETVALIELMRPEGAELKEKVEQDRKLSAAQMVHSLHVNTVDAHHCGAHGARHMVLYLLSVIMKAWVWIEGRGHDPMELLIEKHEYNKTRPFKHGKEY